ncbi:NACHT domain-containing protein [Pseudonocardiaceae bacterium YIM PH 21723]|nr:NACHT domain-containing protein [Pseudonocardiaceae bacterium YIM PH 21723]
MWPMSSAGPERRNWWRLGAFCFPIALAAFYFLLARFLRRQGLENADKWASVIALFLAIAVAATSLWIWLLRRSRPELLSTVDAQVRLRQDVLSAWSEEMAGRGLHVPLQLRWRPSTRPGVQARGSVRERAGVLLGASGEPTAAAITELLRDPGLRQLVILGEPGSGKTTLTVMYMVTANDEAQAEDPVPVLLSIAGWDPGGPLRLTDWIADRISQDYPRATAVSVRELLAQRRLIPVLDGLDEMPETHRGAALSALETEAAAGLRMVLTCRGEEFERAIAEVGPLPQAVVVEVEPVQPGDAAQYLTRREAVGSQRWDDVTNAMAEEPEGPVATALSTPLMISLAQQVFVKPSTDPGELVGLTSTEQVQRRLLDRFLPTAFGSPEAGEQAGRWLAFLITRLPAKDGDPNLEWWRLGRTVPQLVITVLITTTLAVLGCLIGFVTGAVAGAPARWAITGIGLGAVFGLVGSRQVTRSTRQDASASRGWLSVVRGGLTDLAVAAATVSAVFAVALLVLVLVAPTTADGVSETLINTVTRSMDAGSVFSAVFALILSVAVVAFTRGHDGLPRQSRPELRDLFGHLLIGLGLGVALGLPWTLAALLVPGGKVGLTGGMALTAITAGFVGLAFGLKRWLSSPVARPQDGLSPQSALANDRHALLTTGFSTLALITAVIATPSLVFKSDRPLTGLMTALALGAPAGVLAAIGTGAVWMSYTAARFWLARQGSLPWHLDSFLQEAHDSGVLRQAGAVYQVRHDVIREYLLERWKPDPPGRSRVSRLSAVFGQRPIAITATILALASTPLAVATIDPRPIPVATMSGYPKAISADGHRILLGSLPRAQLVDPFTGHVIADIGELSEDANMTFSPDGRILALQRDFAGKIQLWDTNSGATTVTLPPARPELQDRFIKFSRDGSKAATIGRDDHVRLWETSSGREIPTPRAAPHYPASDFMAFSADGRLLATADTDQSLWKSGNPAVVQLWDTSTGTAAGSFGVSTWSSTVRLSPDGQTTTVEDLAGGANHIEVWRTFSSARVTTLTPAVGASDLPVFSGDGRVLATPTSFGGPLQLWDAQTGRHQATMHANFDRSTLILSRDGEILLELSPQREHHRDLRIWNTKSGRLIATLQQAEFSGKPQISPDGKTVAAVAAADGRLHLWRTADGAHLVGLDRESDNPAFTMDSRYLLTHSGGDVRLWEVPAIR